MDDDFPWFVIINNKEQLPDFLVGSFIGTMSTILLVTGSPAHVAESICCATSICCAKQQQELL